MSSGRYRLTTGYNARSAERGEAVLPVHFPYASLSNTDAFTLNAGEQRAIDLRPRVGPVYPVTVAFEGSDSDRSPRLTAASASGTPFQLGTQRNGEAYTVLLPAGTFTLRATSGDREDASTGEARVTVTAHGANQVTLPLASQPVFPVEISFETVSATNSSSVPTTPNVGSFNLWLRNVSNLIDGFNQDVRLSVRPDHSASFQVPPGRYRLGGNVNGAWSVRSATSGVTDLLTEELVVAQGSAGSSIRVIASNASGTLHGTVTTAGLPATGWVYLIPEQPGLLTYSEVYLQATGNFSWSGPPGKYLAVPSWQIVREDFHNSAFLHKFTAGAREVEITNGVDATTDLTLAAEGVAR